MKKILPILFTLFICFIFSNEVNGISCIYNKGDVTFYVYDGGGIATQARASKDFEINGKKYYASTVLNYKDLKLVNGDTLQNSDKCYNYMYFEKNKAYFADSYTDFDYDSNGLVLTRKSSYQDTIGDVILEDMLCTYTSVDAPEALRTFSFKIDAENGTYQLLDSFKSVHNAAYDWNKKGNSVIISAGYTNYAYIDNFHIRLFWDEETRAYSCPKNVYVGTREAIKLGYTETTFEFGYDLKGNLSEYTKDKKFLETEKEIITYGLETYSSYINFEIPSEEQGQICTYSKPNTSNDWDISLQENKKNTGKSYYSVWKKGGTVLTANVNVDTGLIFEDCSNLTEIYTDCLDNTTCTIDTKYFAGSTKLSSNAKMNSEDKDDVIKGTKDLTGEGYKQNLCTLSARLNKLSSYSVLKNTPKLKIYDYSGTTQSEYLITDLDCESWGKPTNYNCTDSTCSSAFGDTNNVITEITEYCTSIFNLYIKNHNNTNLKGRKEECLSFYGFYNDLTSKGIVTDYTEGCNFISTDLGDKLIWVLDLLKIAAPILAIGLGTLDFVKAVASGDSDKEMKTAFKRFSTRIIAAILLFLIPFILSFIMDIFLENQEGYDSDNPFCNLVDWEE